MNLAAICKMFMNCSKTFIGIRSKYDSNTIVAGKFVQRHTKGILDFKELIWLTNVKCLRLSTFYGHWNFAYIHMCVQFQCEMFINSSKYFISIGKKEM